MTCETVQHRAALGDKPDDDVREHLATCAACAFTHRLVAVSAAANAVSAPAVRDHAPRLLVATLLSLAAALLFAVLRPPPHAPVADPALLAEALTDPLSDDDLDDDPFFR